MLRWSQPSVGHILAAFCCQEPLSVNQQKRIMQEARSVNALSKTLATLKVAAEFLAVTGGDPERPLPEYVRQELRMDAGAKQFQDVPVGEGLRAGGKWDPRVLPLMATLATGGGASHPLWL